MKNILVTGGNGLIGYELLNQLSKIENYIINLSQIGCIETKEGYYLVYFKNGNVISIDSGDVLTKWLEMKGSEK
jgi:nucleoside-diphosphate-sugar epimerase